MKENEMDGACSTMWRRKIHDFVAKFKEFLEVAERNSKIMYKWK
jgi:hypothetical protein